MSRDPLLRPVKISLLHPTQITVGMREVEEKRVRLKGHGAQLEKALISHMVPVVIGPGRAYYVVDHHHFCLALLRAGVESAFVLPIADLHRIDEPSFWVNLDARGWCHPYNAAGERVGFGCVPHRIEDLVDDPFRSLAGEVRRAGGYAKEKVAFSEFLWADFFRHRLGAKFLAKQWKKAVTEAVKLARSKEAEHLPGWCGPHDAE